MIRTAIVYIISFILETIGNIGNFMIGVFADAFNIMCERQSKRRHKTHVNDDKREHF